jgi:lysophospholipase L1-like esterase
MISERIIVIGDSSVQGRVDPEGGGWVGRLRKWHESKARHNVIYNLGIGGETTRDLLKRLEFECRSRKPDLIIFSLGINDSRRIGSRTSPNDVPKKEFQFNLKKLINAAQKMAQVIFVSNYPIDDSRTMPIPLDDDKYYLLEDAKGYTEIIKKTVLSQKIPYLDIWSQWIKKNYKELLYKDGLHANSKGHQSIFESVKKFLKDCYRSKNEKNKN